MSIFTRILLISGLALATILPATAFAGTPQLSTTQSLDTKKLYDNAQVITDIFTDKAVYGKFDPATSGAIYRFTPEKDGEQTFTLLSRVLAGSTPGQLVMVLIDPTKGTSAMSIPLALPGPDYHATLLKNTDPTTTYREPLLFQQFNVFAQEKVMLSKGKVYYLLIADPSGHASNYVLKMGTGAAWSAKDVILSFGTWFRLQTSDYGFTSPYHFVPVMLAFLLFLLGLLFLTGIILVEQTFAFLANRFVNAAYTLQQMQPISRVVTWVGLWFTALGGYLFFNDKIGWVGVPFVLVLLFLVFLASLLYQSLIISPQITQLETSKHELIIPKKLRKHWFFSFIITFFSLLAFLVFLVIFLLG